MDRVRHGIGNAESTQAPDVLTTTENPERSAVLRTVAALRADSLAAEPGTLIGSEEALISRYQVSRPTLRQAAGLVAKEQLVRVRRGVGGGYFTERPSISAVAHVAAIFLQTRNTSLDQMLEAIEPIRAALVSDAASKCTPEARDKLATFLNQELAQLEEGLSYRGFLKSERRFGELIGEASGNNVLHLFLEILLELVSTISPERDVFRGKPDRVEEASRRRIEMLRAIIDGEGEIAVLHARRSAQRTIQWMQDDLHAAQ